MKNVLYFIFSSFVLVLFAACDGGGETIEKPVIFLEDVARFEGDNGTSTFSFRVKIDKTSTGTSSKLKNLGKGRAIM